MKECVPYVEFTFVRNVKANIEALRGFSIYIFCPSSFSIQYTVSSNTQRELLSYK